METLERSTYQLCQIMMFYAQVFLVSHSPKQEINMVSNARNGVI